jgi:dihydroorotase-like cyclic amidohydrolase
VDALDLILKNARIHGHIDTVDIGIEQGVIVAIAKSLPVADEVIDLGGRLVRPWSSVEDPVNYVRPCNWVG